MLSDTTKAPIAQAEREAWQALLERLGPELGARCFYRRREKNVRRKVGNLDDFLTRWGGHYEHMIVLDADSVMTGDCLLTLVRTMQANPDAGLVQTVPIPVRQDTFFGRFVQFAAVLYSPMLATGLAFGRPTLPTTGAITPLFALKPLWKPAACPPCRVRRPSVAIFLATTLWRRPFAPGWLEYLFVTPARRLLRRGALKPA